MSEEGGESGGSRAVAIAAKIFLSLKTLATPSGQTQSTNSIRIFPFMTLTAGRGIRVSTYPSHTILAYVIKSGWPHVLLLTRVTRPLTFPFFSVLSSLFFSFFFFNLPTTSFQQTFAPPRFTSTKYLVRNSRNHKSLYSVAIV